MIKISAALVLLSTSLPAQVRTPFDAAVVMADKDACFVKTLDLDGDGWMDALSAYRATSTGNDHDYRLIGFINDHTGNLVRTWSFEIPFSAQLNTATFDQHDLYDVADLNGDGKQDFVVSSGIALRAYLSNGATLPTLAASKDDVNNGYSSIALADFDQDGDLDLAVVHGTQLEIDDIDLVGGTFPLRSSTLTGTAPQGRIVAAELTGDGTPDIFAFSYLVHPVVNGVVQPPTAFTNHWNANGTYDVRNDVGDIDGDGDLDAISFWKFDNGLSSSHGYRILRRVSPTQFVEEAKTFSGGPARRLFDIDGDGDLDALCCGGGGNYSTENGTPSKFRIAWNDGFGNFAESIEIPSLGSTAIAGVADMDHDGRLDLVGGRSVYFPRRPITGSTMPKVGTRSQSERTIVDIDGDGDVDLEPSVLGYECNRGDGQNTVVSLTPPTSPAGYVNSFGGYHGDFDGDGDEDLLVRSYKSNVFAGLRLLRNVGCGRFADGKIITATTAVLNYPQGIDDGLAVDMDLDGDLDLVLRTYSMAIGSSPRSGWWRNDGESGFTYVAEFTGKAILEVVDIDGDAIPDLIASTAAVSPGLPDITLQVAHGLGGGAFGAWNWLFDSAIYKDVEVADLDGDNDVDIVTYKRGATGIPGEVSVRWNQAGAFTTEVLPIAMDKATGLDASIAVLDVDVDGHLDLVVAPVQDAVNTSAVILRRADNSGWQAATLQVLTAESGTSQASGFDPRAVPADVDGDGDQDLVHNRVVENQRFDGGSAGSRLQLDNGFTGTGGIRPVLGATGPFRVGETVHLRLRGALPNTRVRLVSVTTNSLPAPTLPTSVLTAPPYDPRTILLTTSGTSGGAPGSGSFDVAFVVPGDLAGVTRYYTVVVVDPGGQSQRAISNQLELTFRP